MQEKKTRIKKNIGTSKVGRAVNMGGSFQSSDSPSWDLIKLHFFHYLSQPLYGYQKGLGRVFL